MDNDTKNLRKYLNIISEGEHIPMRDNTIRIDQSDYLFLRTLLSLPDPDNYVAPNVYGDQKLMTFWDSTSFLAVKAKLDKFGIKYSDETSETTNFKDHELKPEDNHVLSPYPSNYEIQDHSENGKPLLKQAELPSKVSKVTEKPKQINSGKNSRNGRTRHSG